MALSHALGGPGPLLLLLAALAINGYAAGALAPMLPPGPATLAARFGRWLDRKLNRPERGDTTRLVRGVLVVVVAAALAAALGWLIHALGRALPYGWSLEGLALLVCLQVREPWQRILLVRRALSHHGLEAAREAVGSLTRRDPATLDDHAVGRAAIEAAAKHLNQGVVTPAFWYILLGLPGVLLWTVLNGLDEAIGHRSPRYEQFGRLAARSCDVLNVLPARLTGLLIVVAAAFLGSAKPMVALKTVIKDARYHRSLNAGWPEAAMAGALGLALGGPFRQGEVMVREVWIGQGRARATPTDIDRALALHALSCLVFAGLIGALMLGLAAL
ncbi:MAG: cobalamin biosynthesis protein [Rhodospirillaceae bacterium]